MFAGRKIATLSAGLFALFLSPGLSTAKPMQCNAGVYESVRAPATKQDATVELNCNLTLSPGDTITKRLILSGAAASGTVLDCKGATLDGSRGTVNFSRPSILIRSTRPGNGAWSAPSEITVRNCVIKGAVRLQGLGTNGQAKAVKASSLTADHTAFAQASAPANILLSALTIVADERVPLYIGPGVTKVRVEKSTLKGQSNGPALYLDAESAENTISENRFAVDSPREQIAIDGSARNTISANTFDNPVRGGIFLYRNCGEGGTIRHQKPQYNTISGNMFEYRRTFLVKPAVWMNSRNGWRLYCFRDPAHPFGSSLSSEDFAQFNTVTGNRFTGATPSLIWNSDPSNIVTGNSGQ